MKRIFSMIILAVIVLSAAPAMASDCYYYDSYGEHAYTQDSFSYPTCTKPGYIVLKCTACGKTYKEETGDAYGHDWYEAARKDATCTDKGVIYYCCDECYSEKTETIKALGHKFKVLEVIEEASCVSQGVERVECSRCGKKTIRETDITDHEYGPWQIAIPATDYSKGMRSRSCVNCDHTQSEEFYPEGTLYRGIKDEKEAVKVLQTQLVDCGYLNDKVDGIFGKKTEQAVKDFQAKAGINTDGIAWPQTNKLLDKEWKILKGIYVEEIAVEIPYCVRVENEDGSAEFAYCAEHVVLMDAVDVLFEEEATEEEYINALLLVRQMYQEEVDMRYAEWLEISAEEDRANILGAQAMFTAYLKAQEMVWNMQYGENSETALTKVNDMLHNQWVELCATIELVEAE